MLRWMVRASCFIALLMVASLAAAQTEFSAEIVDNSKKAERGPTKVYFGKDKMRFDSPKSNAEGGGAILDFASRRLIVLMPPRHMYMEIPSQDMEKEGMMSFFRTGDVESACGDWLKLEENKGGTCRKVGNENVNGRSTVKYEGTNARGETGYVWLEPKLRFPVKWQGKNGDGEMRNIQEGPQPASLFEVPAGYTKFDMGGMTKRPQ